MQRSIMARRTIRTRTPQSPKPTLVIDANPGDFWRKVCRRDYDGPRRYRLTDWDLQGRRQRWFEATWGSIELDTEDVFEDTYPVDTSFDDLSLDIEQPARPSFAQLTAERRRTLATSFTDQEPPKRRYSEVVTVPMPSGGKKLIRRRVTRKPTTVLPKHLRDPECLERVGH